MTEMERALHAGRRKMIAAFADLTTLAYRAGVTEKQMDPLHGDFFDGNVEVKTALADILADLWLPHLGSKLL